MADRARTPNLDRTPTAVPADALAANPALLDVQDFAPTLKGGLTGGSDGGLSAATGDNLLPNGGFEEGLGGWTPSGTTTAVSSSAFVSEGSLSAKCTPAGGSDSVYLASDHLSLPEGAQFLTVTFDVRTNFPAAAAQSIVQYYDENDLAVGTFNYGPLTGVTTGATDFKGISQQTGVPAGATSFVVYVACEDRNFVGLVGTEYCYFDNAYVSVANSISGILSGTAFLPGGIIGSYFETEAPADTSTASVGAFNNVQSLIFSYDDAMQFLSLVFCITCDGRVSNTNVAGINVQVAVDYSLDAGATWIRMPGATAINIPLQAAGTNGNTKPYSITRYVRIDGSTITGAEFAFRLIMNQTTGSPGDIFMRDITMNAYSLPINSLLG